MEEKQARRTKGGTAVAVIIANLLPPCHRQRRRRLLALPPPLAPPLRTSPVTTTTAAGGGSIRGLCFRQFWCTVRRPTSRRDPPARHASRLSPQRITNGTLVGVCVTLSASTRPAQGLVLGEFTLQIKAGNTQKCSFYTIFSETGTYIERKATIGWQRTETEFGAHTPYYIHRYFSHE